MAIKKPKIKLYADPRKQPEDTYLIQVQISYGGRAYISTDMKFSKKEWEIIQDRNIKHSKEYNLSRLELEEIREELDAFENRAKEIASNFISQDMPFTATMVRDAFYNFKPATLHKLSLYHLFTNLSEESVVNGKEPKTAESYLYARNAFFNYKKYTEGKKKGRILSASEIESLKNNFRIIEINASFLREFEATMKSPPENSGLRKLSHASIQSYIINLRAVFNNCINEGIISSGSYPFNKNNPKNYYKIRPAQRTKKALFENDLQKLIEVSPQLTKVQRRALDYFIFSVLCNGANLIDIAKFEHRNIDRELMTLSFTRKKTEHTKDKLEHIVIQLTDLHHQIIERNKSKNPKNNYIFDLLDEINELTKTEINRVVANRLKSFKKAYKRISKKADIKRFTFQYARHTFATIAVKHTVSLEDVGKSMGHASPQTTKNYIASLPVEEATDITKFKTSLLGGYGTKDNDESRNN